MDSDETNDSKEIKSKRFIYLTTLNAVLGSFFVGY